MQTDIQVNVDITADQINADTANTLQVTLDTAEPISEYSLGDTIIQGDNLKKITRKTTTLADIRSRITALDSEIAVLQTEKDNLTTTLPLAETKVTTAITELQNRPQIASDSDAPAELVSVTP